jgi:hypothetical protein
LGRPMVRPSGLNGRNACRDSAMPYKPTTGIAKGWRTACWPRSRQTRACRRAFSAVISDTRPARYREINWGEFRARRADGDYADQGEEIQIEHYKFSA